MSKRKKSSPLSQLFLFINSITALLLLLSYLAYYLNPTYFWFISILGLAYPFLLVINAAFALFWIINLNKNCCLPILVIILGWNHIEHHFQLPVINRDTVQNGDISIISYNVQGFHYGDKKYMKDIVSLLDKQNTDIICLQEFFLSAKKRNQIKNTPSLSEYKYKRISRKYGGLVTLSKKKIINSGIISKKGSFPFAVYHDIIIKNDTIRFYNIQLKSIKLKDEKMIFSNMENINNEESTRKIISMINKLKIAYKNRPSQVESILTNISACPYQYILTGDFNVTPLSYTYQKLSSELLDSYIEKGQYTGDSYNENLPPIRIDYILHTKTYKAIDFKILKTKLSDHYPIITSLLKN